MSRIFPIFEGDGGSNLPRYPTVNDFGGLALEDDPKYRPREGKRLRAENYMQLAMAAERVCRMIPVLTIEFSPGYTPDSPTILSVTSVIDAITIDNQSPTGSVSISRVALGVYRVYYPQNALPPKRQLPQLWPCSPALRAYAGTQGSGYVDCYVFDQSGDPTDIKTFKYSLKIFGE